MNATDVVGYAYGADLHCLDCTRGEFGEDLDGKYDLEGNPLTPIFCGEDAFEECSCTEGKCQCSDCKDVHDCALCEGEGKRSVRCGYCGEKLID